MRDRTEQGKGRCKVLPATAQLARATKDAVDTGSKLGIQHVALGFEAHMPETELDDGTVHVPPSSPTSLLPLRAPRVQEQCLVLIA